MTDANIITGQYVRISQTPASIGERLLARIIDFALLITYSISMTFILAIYLPVLLYSFLIETFNNGQSVGKMAMRIKVVNKDGSTPTIGSYFMRWLTFNLEFWTGIGLLCILLSDNSQRLGDMAAGTMVIRKNSYHRIHVSLDEFSYISRHYKPVYTQAERLSLNQIDVIQRTLSSEYGPTRDARMKTLNDKVRALLCIPADENDPEKFLYCIVRDYQHYALEEV